MRVKVELWMGLGKEAGEPFGSASGMCVKLDVDVDEGSTVRDLFGQLSERYPPVSERLFERQKGEFHPDVLVTINERIVNRTKVCDLHLNDGDKLAVFPLQVGG